MKQAQKKPAKSVRSWIINIGASSLLAITIVLLTPSTPFHLSPPQKTENAVILSSLDALPVPASRHIPVFKDETVAAGLVFSHHQGDSHLTGIDETLAPGACALDYDNDGWIDLLLVNGSGQTRYYRKQHWWQKHQGHALYKNLGNGKFQDVTQESGLAIQSWGMGCVSGDFNNDGHTDLFITNLGSNTLYKNNGEGRFIDVTIPSGISGESWSTSATLADYDGDGLLDIYIANYIKYSKGAKTYEAQSQFEGSIPVTFNATLYDAEPNRLYRNRGGFRFEDVSSQAGVEDKDGRSLDAIWLDANNDGQPDIFVSNDGGGGSDTLLINQGNNKFRESSTRMNLSSALAHHGISSGDFDNDGDIDIIITGDQTKTHLLLVNNISDSGKNHWEYSDQAETLGLAKGQFAGYSGWGSGLHDFNNDGWQDLFIANGLVTPDPDTNKITQGQSKQFWLNNGDGEFYEATRNAGDALQDIQSARGSVYADFDNDGDIDIYIAHNNDIGQLLTNTLPTDTRWLGIKLIGTRSNRDAIGARVWLKNEGITQLKIAGRGNSFLSSNDPRIHFGLGNTNTPLTTPLTLTVEWPDGEISNYKNFPLNQYLKIKQGQTSPIPSTAGTITKKPASTLSLSLGASNPWVRIKYIQWITQYAEKNQSLPELEAALADPVETVRLAAIALLKKYKNPDGLRLLLQSLSDKNAAIRRASVSAIRDYEQEESIRWLLRMFSDINSDVRIETAESFAFFFREEEAVIYRKYLAIPYLIRLLDDQEPLVRIAAIRALGDAEQFRAVAPLITRLKDPDIHVRTEAARALGLIREQRAIKPLLALLKNPHEPPPVKAHSLIALKRLAYAGIPSIFKQLLDIKKPSEISLGLDTIIAILSNRNDGPVYSRQKLVTLVDKWYSHADTQFFLSKTTLNEQIVEKIITILRHSGITPSKGLSNNIIQIKNPEIRAKAYTALLKNSSPENVMLAIQGLSDPAESVRSAIFNAAEKINFIPPQKILVESLDNEKTALAAIKAAGKDLNSEMVNRLIDIAYDEEMSTPLRIEALTAASRFNGPAMPVNKTLLEHENGLLKIAALRYWNNSYKSHTQQKLPPPELSNALKNPDIDIKKAAIDILLLRKEPWARRTLVALLSDPALDISVRTYLIQTLSQSDLTYTPAILLKIAQNPLDPLNKLAIEQLVPIQTSLIEKFMWKQLNNPNIKAEIRILAAESLISKHGKQVLKILHENESAT